VNGAIENTKLKTEIRIEIQSKAP